MLKDPPYIKARHFYARRNKPVQLIVIHTMETPERSHIAYDIAKWFAMTDKPVSAHYCIDAESIYQCVWDSYTAFHCKNANANGLGLEHAGRANQTEQNWFDQYSLLTLENSAQVAAYLCNKFRIKLQRAEFKSKTDPTVIRPGFCGHYDVPGHGSHHDPYRELLGGKIDTYSFPWAYYFERVRNYLLEYPSYSQLVTSK